MYGWSDEHKAVLPEAGERLVFGVHRMTFEDRICPMWPKNPAQVADARFSAWRRGAAKKDPQVVALLARVRSGEVPASIAATIVVG